MQSSASKDAGLTLKHWKFDLPASIVVFLVALPLSMGVAVASGATVSAGLVTAIIGGIIVGFISGSPLQVSGPAAGLTVTVFALIQTLGIERLGVCVLVAGILQLIAGYLRMGQWFRAVSPPVIQGMLAGIGVLLVGSQIHIMVDDKPRHSGLENLITIPEAILKSFPAPALGNREERSSETKELRALGQVHLIQVELKDKVHHTMGGFDEEDRTPEQVTAEERRVAGEFQSLVDRQEDVIAQLQDFKSPKSAKQYQDALSSLSVALRDIREANLYQARASQDRAELALREFLASRKNHGWAAMVGMITIITIIGWKLVGRGPVKVIPAALVAVVVATLLTTLVELPVLYVEVPDNLADEIYFPTMAEFRALLDWSTWFFIMQLSVIASAETLLCASAVDRQHTGPRTQYDKELAAQGVGNILCGLLCALPMTGVIVRSSANVQAGAKTRLSTILHGTWILLFVAVFAGLLRYIPYAALAGILVYSGFKLIDFNAIKALARRGAGEVIIYFATVITIVSVDLLVGVLVGFALSLLKLIFVFARLEIEVLKDEEEPKRTLVLRGSATFLRLPALAEALEQVPPNAELHIKVDQLDYIDAACLDLLENWEVQNHGQGGRLVIDAESLQARFWRRRGNFAHIEENGNAKGLTGMALHRQKQRPI